MTNKFMTLIAKLVHITKFSLLEEAQKLIKKFYLHGNVKVEPRSPWAQIPINLKNVQSQRSDQETEEDGSHNAKKSKDLSSGILVQKGANLTRNAHLFLQNFVLHPRRRKKRSKKQRKKRRRAVSPSLSSSSFSSHSSSYEMRVSKKTKKQRGSILHRMKINYFFTMQSVK